MKVGVSVAGNTSPSRETKIRLALARAAHWELMWTYETERIKCENHYLPEGRKLYRRGSKRCLGCGKYAGAGDKVQLLPLVDALLAITYGDALRADLNRATPTLKHFEEVTDETYL